MSGYALGVDPGAPSWYAAVDGERIVTVSEHDDWWPTLRNDPEFSRPAAAMIEWANLDEVYTPRDKYGKPIPTPKSRITAFAKLAVEQERILAIYRDICPVYKVPCRVIRQQAHDSVSKLPGMKRREGETWDQWVSRYLMGLGYAREHGRLGERTWRGTPLAKVGARDAMMAALFNYRDVRNQEYLEAK
jgi:hypothetical protein